MIKKLIQAAALLAVCSGAAQATTYDFSYTFTAENNAGAPKVTGSFDATANGNLLTNISALTISFSNVAFSGSLSIGAWDPSIGTLGGVDFGPNAAVLSLDGTQNNFVAVDSHDPLLQDSWTNLFYYVTGASPSHIGANQEVSVQNALGDSGFDADVIGGVGAWEVRPVPLPAALPLLFSGLGLLAAAKRRRREAGAV